MTNGCSARVVLPHRGIVRPAAITAAGLALLFGAAACRAAADQAPEDNPIVRENQREGTREWILEYPKVVSPRRYFGGVRCPWIEGYCSRTSVRAGEKISFHVSTNPASKFTIDIYRSGYYGGRGGRHVKSFGPLEGKTQKDPQRDAKRNRLLECGWEPCLTFTIPDDWLSGVYLGKLTAVGSGIQSYLIFIVRDDRKADFLFKCSDTTWAAYNRWPDRYSLYEDDKRPWPGGRDSYVSFDRPYGKYYQWATQMLSTGSGEYLCWGFPLAYWMERRGYDVTYVSSLDMHADPKTLYRAKGLISVGHDEYWTQETYDGVKAAVDDGLNVAFLSGNAVVGKIVLEPATDGRALRVMRRGRPSRHIRGTAALIGAYSCGVGFAHFVCRKPGHWVFEGTGMKEGDRILNLVGWEYHGDVLGRQKDLVVLASAPTVKRSTDDPDSDKAWTRRTQYTTIYTGPRGNIIFNGGSCYWALGLSRPPGVVVPETAPYQDVRTQRITQNVLDRIRKSDFPASPAPR